MDQLLVYSPLYRTFSYGPHHPLRPTRLYLTHYLMEACGFLDGPAVRQAEPVPATRDHLLRTHSAGYLEALEAANGGEHFPGALKWGLGLGDNPIFAGVWDWSLLVCGGSLMALSEVAEGNCSVAMHTGGGFHHAHHARAAGFCYLNDLAVAIADQVEKGRKTLYLDIDAHHGDGVQEAFYGSDQVLTVSIHETPDHLFPGTGYERELGEGKGYGYSVNVPLSPGSSDPTFIDAFEAVVPPLLRSFSPDLVVVQLGVDTMTGDPLAHLMLTTRSVEHALARLLEIHSGDIMVSGGGGYEMDTVARSWTLAWGILTGQEVPDELPESYLKERRKYGATGIGQLTIRDPKPDPPPDQVLAHRHLNQTLKSLREFGVI
ncbi:MAG: acetoin utilization protein AcuC [bacterium]|nr:acetoin utilization protein AcuC [bacterium]